jgi:2'-5' RNA ligase
MVALRGEVWLSELIRSFISVDLEEGLLENFRKLREQIASSGADLRLVALENLHLTLRFLGEISRPKVEAVIGGLKELKFNAFRIRFEGAGAFPNLNRPRVVWVGVSEGVEELKALAGKVEKIAAEASIPKAPKGFTPHLTLARVKSGRNLSSLTRVLRELSRVEIGVMEVRAVRLKRSVLTPKGPVYSNLYEVKAVG